MRVLITGGGGFLGQRLAGLLARRGTLGGPNGQTVAIDELVLLDSAVPDLPPGSRVPVWGVQADVTDGDALAQLLTGREASVFHLASMVSAESERHYDAAMAVNLGGLERLLAACRQAASPVRLVFTSSIAVFGGTPARQVVDDWTKQSPETTYGVTKAVGELLVNEATRKGHIDGRSARLPTVIIRPGRPNAAATSWVSGILREPLRGEDSVLPVGLDFGVPVAGYRSVVENLVRLHDLAGDRLGPERGVGFPALNTTPAEMLAALGRVEVRSLGSVRHEPDQATIAFFSHWAERTDASRAHSLGLVGDVGLDALIGEYLEDYGGASAGLPGQDAGAGGSS